MKCGRKIMAILAALMLLVCLAPAALATQTTDYTVLEDQLAIANGLRSHEYTSQTWSAMQKAMDTGKRYVDGKYGQQAVNEAVEALKSARSALVRMDYSLLETTLAEVYSRIDEQPQLHDVWVRINSAVNESVPLLTSGNQQAVDKAVTDLEALLEELSNYEDNTEQEVEVVVQRVEVEVLPTDDYCNIPVHRTWPILFVGSAVLNVVFVVALIFLLMKKRNTYDDTPLVSYDIDDDMDY